MAYADIEQLEKEIKRELDEENERSKCRSYPFVKIIVSSILFGAMLTFAMVKVNDTDQHIGKELLAAADGTLVESNFGTYNFYHSNRGTQGMLVKIIEQGGSRLEGTYWSIKTGERFEITNSYITWNAGRVKVSHGLIFKSVGGDIIFGVFWSKNPKFIGGTDQMIDPNDLVYGNKQFWSLNEVDGKLGSVWKTAKTTYSMKQNEKGKMRFEEIDSCKEGGKIIIQICIVEKNMKRTATYWIRYDDGRESPPRVFADMDARVFSKVKD